MCTEDHRLVWVGRMLKPPRLPILILGGVQETHVSFLLLPKRAFCSCLWKTCVVVSCAWGSAEKEELSDGERC